MIRKAGWVSLVTVLLLTVSAGALDRGATRIERIELQAGFPKVGDRYGLVVTSETALPRSGNVWALRSALGGGSVKPEHAPSQTFWSGELGLAYLSSEMTRIALTGGYAYQGRTVSSDNIWSANLYVRQRILDAWQPVAPYIELRSALRRIDSPRDSGGRTATHDLVLAAVGGLEVRMRHDFAFVFEAGAAHSETFSDGRQRADGVFGAIAMQYDWR